MCSSWKISKLHRHSNFQTCTPTTWQAFCWYSTSAGARQTKPPNQGSTILPPTVHVHGNAKRENARAWPAPFVQKGPSCDGVRNPRTEKRGFLRWNFSARLSVRDRSRRRKVVFLSRSLWVWFSPLSVRWEKGFSSSVRDCLPCLVLRINSLWTLDCW